MTGPVEPLAPRPWHAAALLLLAGLAAYANCFTKAFVFDDMPWIVGNTLLAHPWAYLCSQAMQSRPLISLSLLLNYQLGGLDPFGWHLLNLAVHLGAAVALFGIVRRTLLPLRPADADAVALGAALLWLLHPLQTQSVTYVIQRCESMMGLFFLLAVYCAVRGLSSPRPRLWHAGAIMSAFASMTCKEVAPAIPLVVLAYDWVFVPGRFRPTLARRWGLYLGLFAATWGVYGALSLLPSSGGDSAGFAFKGISPRQYLFTQPGVILHYLRLSGWPTGQALDYIDWPLAREAGDWLPQGLAIVALLGATAWALWQRWWPGFLGAWFFCILGPTSSIVPIADVAFEHRMYLPLAALAVPAALAAFALLGRGGWVAVGIMAASLGLLTFARNEDYRTPEALHADNLRKRPGNDRVGANLAVFLKDRGEDEEALRLLDDALGKDSTQRFVLHQVRSGILMGLGRHREAEEAALEALKLAHFSAITESRLRATIGLSNLLRSPPDLAKAEEGYREAVRVQPLDTATRLVLAYVLSLRGKAGEAEEHLAEALRQKPEVVQGLARSARAAALAEPSADAGKERFRMATALLDARLACFASRHAEAGPLDALATVLAAKGQFKEAAIRAGEAAALAGKEGDVRLAAGARLRQRLFALGKPYTRETARAARSDQRQP